MRPAPSVVAFASLFAACSSPATGEGIGRPSYEPTSRPQRLPLAIVEVYFSDPDPDQRFAIITNSGSVASGLSLVSSLGTVALGDLVGPSEQNQQGENYISLAALAGTGLLGGELAVVDPVDGTVEAYLAWGSDPAVVGSDTGAAAIISDAATAGDFVAAGFPMPMGVAIASTANGSGCVAPSDTIEGLGVPTACPLTADVLGIRQLLPAATSGTDSWVDVENQGSQDADLFGVRLCQGNGCVVVTTDHILSAGKTQRLHLSAGESSDTDLFLGGGAPLTLAGELALIAPGGAELTPSALEAGELQSYVRYGTSARFVDEAVAGGLWPDTTASALPVRIEGEALLQVTDPALVADQFVPAQPLQPGEPLPPIGPATDLWTSCSYPRPWGTPQHPGLVVRQLQRATTGDAAHADRLHLFNRTQAAISFADTELVVVTGGTQSVLDLGAAAPDGLARAQELVIELRPDDGTCTGIVCWPGATLGDVGEVALRASGGTDLDQYVAFGAVNPSDPSTARVLASQAISQNLWPGALGSYGGAGYDIDCALGALDPGDTATLDLSLDGTSPPDWH
jgi:hypothetical protein